MTRVSAESSPRGPRWLDRLCMALGLGSVLLFVGLVFAGHRHDFDDAYMFVRYADHLLAGLGHAWNPDGEQTFGSTSLLHVAVVTVLRAVVPASDRIVLQTSSAAAALAAVAVLVHCCSRYTRAPALHGRRLLWIGVLCPLVMGSKMFLYHGSTGMDTMLALLCNALLIWSVLSALESGGSARVVITAFAAWTVFLARPDHGLYAVLFPALVFGLCGGAAGRRRVGVFLGSLAMMLALDTIVKTWVFGNPLPLPFYAKQVGFYEGYLGSLSWNPLDYLWQFFLVALPALLVIALTTTRRSLPRLTAFLVPVGLTFVYYFSVVQIMGVRARFYFPALPYFIVAAALCADDALVRGSGVRVRRLMAILPGLVVCASLSLAVKPLGRLFLEPSGVVVPPEPSTEAEAALPRLGWWRAVNAIATLASRLPPGSVIALSEHGLVGARAPAVTIIDLVALHDPLYAHEGFSSVDLMERRPDVIWLPHRDYTRLLAEILSDPTFRRTYDFYPGGFDFGMAVRKDTSASVKEYVRDAWDTAYPRDRMASHLGRW